MQDIHSMQQRPANFFVAKRVSIDPQQHPFAIGKGVGIFYGGDALETPAFPSVPGGMSGQTLTLRKAESSAGSSSPSHVVTPITWQIFFLGWRG